MPFTDLFTGLFRKADPEPTPEPVTLTDPLASWLFGAMPTHSNVSVTPKSAMQVPAVSSAVELIAEAVGTLPVKLFVRNAKGKEADPAHAAFRLAHDEANDWTSAAELRTQLTHDALLHDRGGFALANRVDGRVVEFIRLDPTTVEPKTDDATSEPFYVVRQGRKNVRYEYRDVLHIQAFGGSAPINRARNAIALAMDLERHAAKLFTNGARPSGILSTDAKSPAALKNIADMWNATHGDPNDTGKPAILPDGTAFQFNALTITEISLCRRPVHPGARITSIKSITKETRMEPEEVQAAIDAAITETKAESAKLTARLDKVEAKANRPLAANDNQPGAANDNERKAFADFVRNGDATEVKSLGYSSPSTGGILAPEQVATTILEKVAEFSPVRSLAQTISMSGPLLQLPRLVDEVDPVPVAETAARTEDEPTFDQIDLKPFEMAIIVPVTRILLEDAQIDLTGYLSNHVARRFGQKEATWFVNGNGTTQAEGILTSAAVAAHEVEAVTGDDLIDLFYSIKTAYSSNGAWLMNRKTMSVVRKLKDTDGSYIWERGIAGGQPPSLLGRPVYEAVDMPDIADAATPIVFGDFAAGYAIADRTGFEIIRDDLTGAGNGIVKLHARRRVGGRIIMGEALTKLKIAA